MAEERYRRNSTLSNITIELEQPFTGTPMADLAVVRRPDERTRVLEAALARLPWGKDKGRA
jgi:hypothetical protein